MSKGLEALQEIKNNPKLDLNDVYIRFDIIEKELKEYEGAKNHIEALHKERIENSLKIKALEVINEHEINVYWLKTSPNLSRYNLAVGTNQALKKDEYDLLKEILK